MEDWEENATKESYEKGLLHGQNSAKSEGYNVRKISWNIRIFFGKQYAWQSFKKCPQMRIFVENSIIEEDFEFLQKWIFEEIRFLQEFSKKKTLKYSIFSEKRFDEV